MDFSILLKSKSPAVQRRAMSVLLSSLEINPLPIFENFPQYSKRFLSLFFDGTEQGLAFHSSVTPMLVESALSVFDEIPQKSLIPLFKFFIQCLNRCYIISDNSDEKTMFADGSSEDPFIYKPILGFILNKIKENNQMEEISLEDIICLMKNNVSTAILSNEKELIKSKIIENPEEGFISFVDLIKNDFSAPLPLECIKIVCKENPELASKHLWKHSHFLNSVSNGEINFEPSPEFFSESVVLKQVHDVLNKISVSKVNEYDLSEISSKGDIKKDMIDLQNTMNNEEEALMYPFHKANELFNDVRPIPETKDPSTMQHMNLECYAEKKGGLRHNSWQRRYFKFYASNNCIVWRDTPTSKEVKGVLILTTASKVEIFYKKGSRRPFRLIINPGEGQKNYLLAFDTKEHVLAWNTALLTSCNQQ